MNTDKHRYFGRSFLLITALFALTGLACGQVATAKPLAPNVREAKLASKMMGREMPYRVVLPAGYDDAKEQRFAVIYLLHGLTGHYNNWIDATKVAAYALNHKFIIVTPEGDNGWYTDSVTKPADKYESYIVKELIPEIDAKFRTLANRDNRLITGLSMGGFGGVKFGLKYPEMFAIAGSFSGALGAASFTEKNAATAGRGIDAIMGAEGGEWRAANDVFRLVRDLTPEKIKALPFIYQSCGTEDFLIQNNREFMMLLVEKKVPHEYRQHPGVHNWVFWDDQIREFLQVAERRMKK
ncbi:MAG: alpha/beta hydrolase family protein [Pyrinomonadaceae bacterium]